jgi:hypothetical protein
MVTHLLEHANELGGAGAKSLSTEDLAVGSSDSVSLH